MNCNAVVVEPFKVRNRLAELGLEEADLLEAVRRGISAGFECTENHPPQSAGYNRWSETVAALRERMLPKDWTRLNDNNLPLTIDPTGTVAIAVTTGDAGTGDPNINPCTRSPKGPRTTEKVRDNRQMCFVWDNIPLRPEHLAPDHERMLWLLLIYQDIERREFRSELSRPTDWNDEDRVDEWAERIILSSIPFDGDVLNIPVDNAPQTPELDVEIRRRG